MKDKDFMPTQKQITLLFEFLFPFALLILDLLFGFWWLISDLKQGIFLLGATFVALVHFWLVDYSKRVNRTSFYLLYIFPWLLCVTSFMYGFIRY